MRSRTCGLAADWEVHSSPADRLDYALLRLARRAGEDPVGDFQNAPRRGWLKLRRNDVRPITVGSQCSDWRTAGKLPWQHHSDELRNDHSRLH